MTTTETLVRRMLVECKVAIGFGCVTAVLLIGVSIFALTQPKSTPSIASLQQFLFLFAAGPILYARLCGHLIELASSSGRASE